MNEYPKIIENLIFIDEKTAYKTSDIKMIKRFYNRVCIYIQNVPQIHVVTCDSMNKAHDVYNQLITQY